MSQQSQCIIAELQRLFCPAICWSAAQADIPDSSLLYAVLHYLWCRQGCIQQSTTRSCSSHLMKETKIFNSKKIERLVLESSHVFKGIRMDMKRLFSLAEKGITKTGSWKVMPNEFKLKIQVINYRNTLEGKIMDWWSCSMSSYSFQAHS